MLVEYRLLMMAVLVSGGSSCSTLLRSLEPYLSTDFRFENTG